MSQQLISLNKDLKRLRDEGYQIEIHGGHLVALHIPYVNNKKEVHLGTFACPLDLNGQSTIKPSNHVIMFQGEQPCNQQGMVIAGIVHSNSNTVIKEGLTMNLSFSNKPKGGYSDFYHKIKTYAEIISAPAKFLDGTVTEKPFLPVSTEDYGEVFKYLDTNSSRANIENINLKLAHQKIAIVGLGGTGSYILDLVSKTMVKEIHIFDGDDFSNHNAFRSPGAASLADLQARPKKVDYFHKVYSNMRNSLYSHNKFITESNMEELLDMNCVFLCIDDNEMRYKCATFLSEHSKRFIDVGLGVNVVEGKLIGTIRTTCVTDEKKDHIERRIPQGLNDDNDYSSNIQIAELNNLNAIFAVLKWKKQSGIFQDLEYEHHSLYSINDSQLINEEVYET